MQGLILNLQKKIILDVLFKNIFMQKLILINRVDTAYQRKIHCTRAS